MPTKRRTMATLAVVASIALVLSGCGGSGGDTPTTPANTAAENTPDAQNGPDGAAECVPGQAPVGKTPAEILAEAGVPTPVTIPLQYNPDHYGSNSDQEYALIKGQLEDTGLFQVDLQSAEWVTYNKQRNTDYPVYQLGWFPDFPDADNYLTPFFDTESFLHNNFNDKCVVDLLAQERTATDPAEREQLLQDLQKELATKLSTIPLLQGAQVAITGKDITGVDKTLDASFQFRFATIQKGGDAQAKVAVGTTDTVTSLDPAGSYDNGSYAVALNVYPFVLGFAPGNPVPTPDLAESCDWAEDGKVYSCKIKPGLTWANGHTLDANDVKFSYDRQVGINDPNGPASLLTNLDSVEVPDPLTVNFRLTDANDVTFPQVLASPVGPIVDDEVFSATALTSDDEIMAGNAFAGPYAITSWKLNELVEYAPFDGYNGTHGTVANGGATMKYYSEESNMRLEIENGDIDVAWRSLSPTDVAALEEGGKVNVVTGPGGEIRYIVFNIDTQPGDTPAQKLAIRQAIAASINRGELASQVYKDTKTPLCSYVPDGLPGANTAVCDAYGGGAS